jgi:hypothetical protein
MYYNFKLDRVQVHLAKLLSSVLPLLNEEKKIVGRDEHVTALSVLYGFLCLHFNKRAPPSVLDAEMDKRPTVGIVWTVEFLHMVTTLTTFLCSTWVSVTAHPNIQPYKLGGSQLERPLKVVSLCYAMVAPEAIQVVVWGYDGISCGKLDQR